MSDVRFYWIQNRVRLDSTVAYESTYIRSLGTSRLDRLLSNYKKLAPTGSALCFALIASNREHPRLLHSPDAVTSMALLC